MEKTSKTAVKMLKCKVLVQMGIGIDRERDRELVLPVGAIVDLPEEEALRLAGRSIEGYPSIKTANGGIVCGTVPTLGGAVHSPIVEIVGDAA